MNVSSDAPPCVGGSVRRSDRLRHALVQAAKPQHSTSAFSAKLRSGKKGSLLTCDRMRVDDQQEHDVLKQDAGDERP